jgi:hypothetical protein
MEYCIVTHWNATKLQETVNAYIKSGWVPQGGVSIAVAPGGDERFAQAMIRGVK